MASYAMGRLQLLNLESPPPLPDSVIAELDVEYGREGDIPLLLDVYRPKNITTPRPAIVFIPWRRLGQGKPQGLHHLCPAVCRMGLCGGDHWLSLQRRGQVPRLCERF